MASNCVLYEEPYIYPFQLTVTLKFNQSHPTKSSKTLFITSAALQICKAFNFCAR